MARGRNGGYVRGEISKTNLDWILFVCNQKVACSF